MTKNLANKNANADSLNSLPKTNTMDPHASTKSLQMELASQSHQIEMLRDENSKMAEQIRQARPLHKSINALGTRGISPGGSMGMPPMAMGGIGGRGGMAGSSRPALGTYNPPNLRRMWQLEAAASRGLPGQSYYPSSDAGQYLRTNYASDNQPDPLIQLVNHRSAARMGGSPSKRMSSMWNLPQPNFGGMGLPPTPSLSTGGRGLPVVRPKQPGPLDMFIHLDHEHGSSTFYVNSEDFRQASPMLWLNAVVDQDDKMMHLHLGHTEDALVIDAFVNWLRSGDLPLDGPRHPDMMGSTCLPTAALLVKCMYFGGKWDFRGFATTAATEYETLIKDNQDGVVQLAQDLTNTYDPQAEQGSLIVRAYLLYTAARWRYHDMMLQNDECRRILSQHGGEPIRAILSDQHTFGKSDTLRLTRLQQRLKD
ncbi:hypothetical protein LTR08_007941 [Meristemomyces frigidus]|nr:hypothetical protein LTR08_007941 [Meristemomyces frigidus]